MSEEAKIPERYKVVKVTIAGRDPVKAYIGSDDRWHRLGGEEITEEIEKWEFYVGYNRS